MEHALTEVSLDLRCSDCSERETVSAHTIADLEPKIARLEAAGWVVQTPVRCPNCKMSQAGTIWVRHQLTQPQLAELKDWWTHRQHVGCTPPPRPPESQDPDLSFEPPLLTALARVLARPWRAIARALRALFAPRDPATRRRLADEHLLRQINGGRGL